jgi:putative transposase
MNALDAMLIAGVQIDNVQRWCRQNNINPRTFYRHRARILAEGCWQPRSRRPHRSPGQTSPELDARICDLRATLGVDNGADHIRDALTAIAATGHHDWRVPARSTINRVLARHDLLDTNPAKRPRSSWHRFAYARPRDCYQIDATQIRLAGGRTVVVFDVLDDCTRLLVACHAAPAETASAAITAIQHAFTTFGPPAIVLSDNGTAFTNRHRNPNTGPSTFATHVHAAGTRLIHSSPYHPQTCGKVERHHHTLKTWLATQPPPRTLTRLQQLLDIYQQHYNHRRHSALPHRQTPHHAWTTSPDHGSPHTLPRQTDATVHHLKVARNGVIIISRTRIGLGTHYAGRTITAIRNDQHITIYTPDGRPLGTTTINPTNSVNTAYQRLTPTP